jgi:hypothetical protein
MGTVVTVATAIDVVLLLACLLGAVVLFGVARRLKAVEQRVGGSTGGPPNMETKALAGRPVPEFLATSDDGRTVDDTMLRQERVLLGVFDAECPPCHQQAPQFATLAATESGSRSVAVVMGAPGVQRDELTEALRDSIIVTGPQADTVVAAFGLTVYPTLIRTDGDGRIDAATNATAALARQSLTGA